MPRILVLNKKTPYRGKMNKKYSLIIIKLAFIVILSGCSGLQKKEDSLTAFYSLEKGNLSYQPVFQVLEYENEHNRIGSPSVNIKDEDDFFIDTSKPAFFFKEIPFSTEKGKYTNLVYRIHFPLVPYFHLTAGNNPGLLAIVTLNSDHKPVLVTTVHTCGCYNAIIPTNYMPEDAYPDDWKNGARKESVDVYGESLPSILDFSDLKSPAVLYKIRPDVHRVMDICPVESAGFYSDSDQLRFVSNLREMSELEKIPAKGRKTANFFHDKGVMKGHVKGTIKPLEMIFMSIISLDLFVGSDKIYSPPDEYGNPFYTSLKPWNRHESDMRDFARYLKFWGWKL